MIEGLHVVGTYKGASGYDRHTREFVRQFIQMGVPVQLFNLEGWSLDLPPEERETCFDSLTAPVEANHVLHFAMPVHVRKRPGKLNVNYTMFEANRIPQIWVDCASVPDLIILPTESSLRAWVESGVSEERLRLCPLGVDGAVFAQKTEPLAATTRDGRPVVSFGKRFLNIAQLTPRKNQLGLLRSWILATRFDDDAILIIKAFSYSQRDIDDFQYDLEEIQRKLGKTLQEAAPVIWISQTLSDQKLRSLYNTATHYISMSNGEGWDLVMMEAICAGLQIIAPFHSAYLTYLREEDAWLIPAVLTPAVFEGRFVTGVADYFKGLSWWQPDEDAAAAIIKKIIQGQEAKPSPRDRIIAEYSWENAARRLLQILEE